MPNEITIPKVLIIGTYQATDAYPNVKYKIEAIKKDATISCIEINSCVKLSFDYRSKFTKILSMLRASIALSTRTLRCIGYAVAHKDACAVYVPYPATHILFAMSLLPKFMRPKRIIADVFISLYDTVVLDRKLLRLDSFPATALKYFEARALTVADSLIADTTESAKHIADLLGLDISRFTAIPLATNEAVFKPHSSAPREETPLAVIFIGTLVPLHGIEIILEALQRIESTVRLNMTFVGDGQESQKLKSFLSSEDRGTGTIKYRWIRRWQNSSQLHELIGQSDLCMGIMKNTGKSARVWPFKNYLYMASEKALITAQTPVSIRLAGETSPPPFITVNTNCASELAASLTHFSTYKAQLEPIAKSGRQLYERTLSNASGYAQLKNILIE